MVEQLHSMNEALGWTLLSSQKPPKTMTQNTEVPCSRDEWQTRAAMSRVHLQFPGYHVPDSLCTLSHCIQVRVV